MTVPGFRIRHLSFHGSNREPAAIEFGPGLNVLYGASDTGKSFVVDAIDFMLGGKPPLRDIPERVGYDRVLMAIETMAGEVHTLSRSADGGRFTLYPGLHTDVKVLTGDGRELSDQHSDRNADNLSSFLLQLCDLSGKRVRKNKAGDTNSLSFRNIARLQIVTETEITAQRSPLTDGNPTADTPNFATFKLLLTGVDDSALRGGKPATPEDQSREAQLGLLDSMIGDYESRLKQLTKSPDELNDQMERLDASLSREVERLSVTEAEYRKASSRRRELRSRLEEGRDRRAEIASLLERFELLALHYDSDVARLQGIEEAGTLFEVLGQTICPLCGAAPEHHRHEASCDGDVEAVVTAARSEIAKIDLLRKELTDTQAALEREAVSFDRRLPRIEEELQTLASQIEQTISPELSRRRTGYGDLADKRGEVREALSVQETLRDMEQRREALNQSGGGERTANVADGDLPSTIAERFALKVEAILKAWHFPEAERVFFDSKSRDLMIAGKQRTARGKGLRAITHAAFTIGLLEYCREQETPHPGFVVLDSPLLAYRAPDGDEDDLTGTDLNQQFYGHLAALPDNRQVIIVENSNPPSDIMTLPQSLMFSRNPHSGRYGFFPLPSLQSDAPLA